MQETIDAANRIGARNVYLNHNFLIQCTQTPAGGITGLTHKLDPRQFIRIHRSSIVNLNQIREIYREGPMEGSVVLTNGQTLRLSKAGRHKINEIGRISG